MASQTRSAHDRGTRALGHTAEQQLTADNSPWTQVTLTGIICFLSPGLFNALSGLGAGGTDDVTTINVGNSVLYACFCLMGFFAGSINNAFGPRLTMCIGTMGYSLYVGSLWAFGIHGTHLTAFVIVASGILGCCASLLWTAQGAIMMAYPMEKDKGRSFSLFWSVFTMGGVVGSAIALGITAKQNKGASVSTAVYITFVILMIIAIFVCWLVLPPYYVVRGDGTLVKLESDATVVEEIKAFARQFLDWKMIMLFPMFFTSNYFYAYQGSIVSKMFTPRGRALAALLSNLGAVFGAIAVGFVLDYFPGGRRRRAIAGWCYTLFMLCLVWGAGIGFQTRFKRTDNGKEPLGWDWNDGISHGPLTLLFAYYFCDSAYQGLAYYTMAGLTNDPYKLARMTAYYKGVQSAGAAISFGMDAVKTPYLTEVIVSFVIMLFSMPLCLYILWGFKETNYDEEGVVHVEDLDEDQVHHAAIPSGHHVHDTEAVPPADEKASTEVHEIEQKH